MIHPHVKVLNTTDPAGRHLSLYMTTAMIKYLLTHIVLLGTTRVIYLSQQNYRYYLPL